uniref:Uncharacterized protein n=1 Tax=Rhizochromulina marina TaxID=1034831 RepID=A0A7S2RKW6_9STRA|mmetsp:Transcript_17813/g.52007  ORF Transcript_17813/g.52007 Transcript_17813/m.52007 type:complete len:187 (+) Transcript_17813:257-817(+)
MTGAPSWWLALLLHRYSSSGLQRQVDVITERLLYNTNRTVVEFAVEIEILVLEESMLIETELDSQLTALRDEHSLLEERYRDALLRTGMSPEELDKQVALSAATAGGVQSPPTRATRDGTTSSTLFLFASSPSSAPSSTPRTPLDVDLGMLSFTIVVAVMFSVGILVEKGRAWVTVWRQSGDYKPI